MSHNFMDFLECRTYRRHLIIMGVKNNLICRGCYDNEETALIFCTNMRHILPINLSILGQHLLQPWELHDNLFFTELRFDYWPLLVFWLGDSTVDLQLQCWVLFEPSYFDSFIYSRCINFFIGIQIRIFFIL